MFFVFSGEGPTDLGVCSNGLHHCSGEQYLHGPMTVIVDQIVESKYSYSILEFQQCAFYRKSELTDGASELKAVKRVTVLPGLRRARETAHFFNNARVLARIALRLMSERSEEVVAVLFRDSDTESQREWNEKRNSIAMGFSRERFDRGIPMVPMPTSEAWVLCALKKNPGMEAAGQSYSGMKRSDALKRELEDLLEEHPSRERLCELLSDRRIDCAKIDTECFAEFKTRLEEAI